MSSMVSGTDVIFDTARQGFGTLPILGAVLEVWPEGLFQDAEEEGARPLTAVLADQQVGASREFFVYKDRVSADSWDREGWTEEHGIDMAHFLVRDDAGRPDVLQLTLVVGSVAGETIRLVAAVFEALGRMARPSFPGPS